MHTSDDIDHDRHLLGSLLGVAALGALLTWSLRSVQQVHQRRRADREAPVAQGLQTWESEGGRPTATGQPELTPDLTP